MKEIKKQIDVRSLRTHLRKVRSKIVKQNPGLYTDRIDIQGTMLILSDGYDRHVLYQAVTTPSGVGYKHNLIKKYWVDNNKTHEIKNIKLNNIKFTQLDYGEDDPLSQVG